MNYKNLPFSGGMNIALVHDLLSTNQTISKDTFLEIFRKSFIDLYSITKLEVFTDEIQEKISKEGFVKYYIDNILPNMIDDRNVFLNIYLKLMDLDKNDPDVLAKIFNDLSLIEAVIKFFTDIKDILNPSELLHVEKIINCSKSKTLEDIAIKTGYYTVVEYTNYIIKITTGFEISSDDLEKSKDKKIETKDFTIVTHDLSEDLEKMSKEKLEKLSEEKINKLLDKKNK